MVNQIALFADKAVLPGLHVTLYSALRHWQGTQKLSIFLFHSNLSDADLTGLRLTLHACGKGFEFNPLRFEPEQFCHLPGMHGSQIIYGRLLLPELMPQATRVLYLDADLLILDDLSRLTMIDMGGKPVGAVFGSEFRWSLESEFCKELNIDPSAPNFNSGVLLLDCDSWRKGGWTQKCLEFSSKFGSRLWGDQTVVNCVFYHEIMTLSPSWNTIIYPSSAPITRPSGAVYHFVGAPKPFDIFGGLLHGNFPLFQSYLEQTSMRHWTPYSPKNLFNLRRNVLLGPAILRNARRKVFGSK